MNKKPLSASIIYVVLGLIFIALIGIRTISSPGIWTHLAQGRTNAPISFVETERTVNTTHMYDKVVFGLWNAGGAPLLIILNVIMLLGTYILLLRVSREWGGELSRGFALLIAGHLIFKGLDVGPQTVMMLFIALFIFLLTTVKNPPVLFGSLIALQVVWTNLHGSFLFGPLLAALAAIEAGQSAKRRKKDGMPAGMLGILAVALLAATVINPYFLKLHAQVMTNLKMPSLIYWGSHFTEYFQPPTHGPLIFFTLILGAGGLITLKQRLPVMLTSLAIIAAFLIVRSAYSATLFAVLAFPFMVLSFSAVGEYLINALRPVIGKQAGLLKPAVQAVFVVLVILSILPVVSNCAYARLGSASSFGLGIEEGLYPSGPKALLENPAFPERALNLATDGGYLAFNYGRTIFIDYRPGCYGRDLLANMNGMMLGEADAYNTIMDTYRPEAVILNTLSPSSAQGLVKLLARPVWKLAYFDGVTAILLLNKEEFSPMLNDEEIQSAGLARLEAARAAYAEEASRGCRAGNPAELIGSGKIFLALNRPEQSRAIFSLLLQGNDSVPGWWLGLGNSQLMLKDFEAAAVSLKTATELDPDNWYAWAGYANVCNRLGRNIERDEAIKKMRAMSDEMTETADMEEPVVQSEPEAEPAGKKTQSIQDITIPE